MLDDVNLIRRLVMIECKKDCKCDGCEEQRWEYEQDTLPAEEEWESYQD